MTSRDVLAALAAVVDREDFAALERAPDDGRWSVALYDGRLKGITRLCTWTERETLVDVLTWVRAKPVVKLAPLPSPQLEIGRES